MTESVVLSICIPAYNRPYELGRLLSSIQKQWVSGVEVVITDDSDTDVIEEAIQQYSDLAIVYIKNEKRLGFSQNLLHATRKARGTYIWWMGDDDTIVDGGIAYVLQCIQKHPEMIWINVQSERFPKPYVKNISEGFLATKNDPFLKIGNLLTFISTIILRADAINLDREDIVKYHDSLFINFVLVADILARGGQCYVVKYPYIKAYWPEPGNGWAAFPVFGVEFLRATEFSKPFFSSRAQRAMIASVFHYCWRGMLLEWAIIGRSPKPSIIPLIARYWSFPELYIAIPLLLLPRYLVRGLYVVYKMYEK